PSLIASVTQILASAASVAARVSGFRLMELAEDVALGLAAAPDAELPTDPEQAYSAAFPAKAGLRVSLQAAVETMQSRLKAAALATEIGDDPSKAKSPGELV